MTRTFLALALFSLAASAGQVPGRANAPDVPITNQDRVYTADQFSNTVSVMCPAADNLLVAIKRGEHQPANLAPPYKGELLVHGLGFSPDPRTLPVVSIGSNPVTFVDTTS